MLDLIQEAAFEAVLSKEAATPFPMGTLSADFGRSLRVDMGA